MKKISRRFFDIRTHLRMRLRAPGSSSPTATCARRALPRPDRAERTVAWQDPIPALDHPLVDEKDIAALKGKLLASGLTIPELVFTAWASASSSAAATGEAAPMARAFGFEPQKNWDVNQSAQLARTLGKLEEIQKAFNTSGAGGKKVSLADLIILGGGAAVEKAAKEAGTRM